MPANDNKQRDNLNWRQAMVTVGLALAIPWMIGVPAIIGWYVDRNYTHTYPLFLIIGLCVGLLSTAFDIYVLLKRFGQVK
jgi:F0F1-type ATP synthase assembly protein I